MLNFTVGPVQSDDEVRAIGANQVPYFRTPEFSSVMLENEKLMKEFTYAPEDAKVAFITGSGTASMEATIINCFDQTDRVLIVNGGSFGHRFVQLCEIHGIEFDEISLAPGKTLTSEDLNKINGDRYTGFLVNVHETSTGVHYDLNLIKEFCDKYSLFLVVDAISSFLADNINMEESDIDVLITGSQKALACPPGVSIIVLSPNAIERVNKIDPHSLYLNLKNALVNGLRGQTPFTPAVGILLQINARLKQIQADGGVTAETARISELATYFRNKLAELQLPLEICSDSLSNAVTPLHPTDGKSAYQIFSTLKDEYNIWVCPNGGDFKDSIFRVGHIGYLKIKDYDLLLSAMKDMKARDLL